MSGGRSRDDRLAIDGAGLQPRRIDLLYIHDTVRFAAGWAVTIEQGWAKQPTVALEAMIMATMQVFQETGRVAEVTLLRHENAQLRNENEQLRQQVIEVTTILIRVVADKAQTH